VAARDWLGECRTDADTRERRWVGTIAASGAGALVGTLFVVPGGFVD